jgi:hypothetical protein
MPEKSRGELIMLEIIAANPWLIVVVGGLLIPIFGIVFGTVTGYLRHIRQAELDASLKHEMLQRGMSAAEITQVIQARSWGKKFGKGHSCPADDVASLKT